LEQNQRHTGQNGLGKVHFFLLNQSHLRYDGSREKII
jgi:hypothetical protein